MKYFIILSILILSTTACQHAAKDQSQTQLAILQGATTDFETQISVLVTKDAKLKYSWGKDGIPQRFQITPQKRATREDSPYALDIFKITGLTPRQIYTFRIENEAQVLDERSFQSLDLKTKKARFIIASCFDETFVKEQKQIWPEVFSQSPDFLLLIGDNAYVTKRIARKGYATNNELWSRHVDARLKLALYRQNRLIPSFTTWDDNDFGMNDGDSSYAHSRTSREIYESFFPMNEISTSYKRGPGLASQISIAGQNFILTDNRSFKEAPEKPNQLGSHWGLSQWRWIDQQVQAQKQPLWLIDGGQFFGAYHRFESFEKDHPKLFNQRLSVMRKWPQPVVFVSGDRHLAEVMQITLPDMPYTTYELTSSALHAKTYESWGENEKNPRQIWGQDRTLNYLLIESENKNAELVADLNFFGLNKTLLYSKRISVGVKK